jgi:DNA-binding beta-propeller fold protein YncE
MSHILVSAALTFLLSVPAAHTADQSCLELTQTIVLKGKAGKLDHLALDAKRERLLLANKTNNTLDVVDLKAGKLLQQIAGQQGVQGVAYAEDLDRIYVGLGVRGFCNIFDGGTYAPLKSIKFADDADNVRYNPRTHLVYIAHAEKSIGVVDARTFTQKADIKLPGAVESFQMEQARPRLYANVPETGEVAVVDTDKHEVFAKYPLKLAGGNYPMALDETHHRLFVGCRKEPMVVVLDTETGKELAGVAIPKDIDDLFYDAERKRLYASCGEGFLTVIAQKDADHYEVAEKLPTAKDARTCLFAPGLSRLFLAVPRQEGKEGPEIRVFQVKP